MKEVCGVRFKTPGKIYYFDPNGIELQNEDFVIVETSMGKEFGIVGIAKKNIDEEMHKEELKKVLKKASKEDIKQNDINKKDQNRALDTVRKKVKEHKLEMNVIEARYLFDRSKIIFYFVADGRIDFRDLVKDLAAIFKTRIELRQISTRDQVKKMGGLGPCGRELCCCSFLESYGQVSIKMAKEQNLSLNAAKITGNCGRLMCCLRYEQNVYDDKMKKLPHVGAIVKTEDGEGTVDQVEVLKEILKVKLQDENENFYYKKFNASDVTIIKDNKRKSSNDEGLSAEELAELKKIEAMDNYDNKNRTKDDDV